LQKSRQTMASSIVEKTRQLHADIERCERGGVFAVPLFSRNVRCSYNSNPCAAQ
jgi:hypothetical protein